MPIVEDYDAIAKRLRELKSTSPKTADESANSEQWRDQALDAARVYVESRRRNIAKVHVLPRRA